MKSKRKFKVSNVLKAAAILADLSATDIAIKTGIKVSRMERILSGRTPPRHDEPERILKACGALQTPVGQAALAAILAATV